MKTKVVSSLEKCFIFDKIEDFSAVKSLRVFKNEKCAIQLLMFDDKAGRAREFFKVKVEGCEVKLRYVESVPSYVSGEDIPEKIMEVDPHLLNGAKPGLYPDILMPLQKAGRVPYAYATLRAVWIDLLTADEGIFPIKISVFNEEDKCVAEEELTLEVLPIELPSQETKYGNWFYCDCIADYYDLEVFSDKHFEYIEKWLKVAAEHGQNIILVPVFTPPLDTEIGYERTTTQLVGVAVENGAYKFDFSLVDRFIDMCDRVGFKYLEISHLFTQWGAYHAPKIMATVDGEYKRIFGWDTDATGEEYVKFLRAFLTEFTAYLKARGDDRRTYFHLSDEPRENHLEQYKKNRANVLDILRDFKIIDALSHVEYYKDGVCEIPIPFYEKIEDFMQVEIPERWVYYCGEPVIPGASNRFLVNTLSRTRSIGIQMYKYGIEAFGHWGFNYYNNENSYDFANPFLSACAGYWNAGGDAFLVYPYYRGEVLESIRIHAMRNAMEDIRLFKLCESYYDKETVVSAIEEISGEINFRKCVEKSEIMLAIREKIIDMILVKL